MTKKIVSINPNVRITEDNLTQLKDYLEKIKPEEVQSLLFVHMLPGGECVFNVLGGDMETLGSFYFALQIYSDEIKESLSVNFND